MSLDRYRRMRDFARTPEPAGGETAGGEAAGGGKAPAGERAAAGWRAPAGGAPAGGATPGRRRFVVQRHRARRLHYDFRLEMDGVLVSWAVPRGPSLRPLERRMAARTEDHPLEYLDFEGVIPAGEYGGGDVIVWDRGTWEPEESDDPGAAVRAGELKFRLQGERLKGRFVIVRTRWAGRDREDWLLIHKRGEGAHSTWDIDDFPTSVKSGRTNDQVRAGIPAIWASSAPPAEASIDLSAAVAAPLPDFIAPMAATPVDRAFSDEDWLFELKLDGYRVEAVVNGGRMRAWTRNRQDAARWFPAFAAAPPAWIAASEAIVDGEMVALDEKGRPDFSLLQDLSGMRGLAVHRGERQAAGAEAPGRSGALVYHAFDLLHLDGRSLLRVPLEDRKRLLRRVLRDSPSVRYLEHVAEHGEDFLAAVRAQGLEGVVAKRRRSRYEPGRRSRAWLKVKARREQELVVVGWEAGRGSHAELGSLLVATRDGDGWRFAGQVGSGLDARERAWFRRELEAAALAVPPVHDPPPIRGARWSEPRQVIRAEFTEWTSDGLLRQAAYRGREPDRDPHLVIRERAEAADAARERAERAGRATGRQGGRQAKPTSTVVGAAPTASRPALADLPASAMIPVAPAALVARPAPPGHRSGHGSALPLVRSTGSVGDPPAAITEAELAALEALGREGSWHVGGHVVRLTNLDKVLFPEPGYTKRDLVRYYVTVAPLLLPHLRDRPLNADRWPDGVTGHHFWQKQIPSHAPAWVGRWDYPEAGHDQSHTYVMADRVATMAWLANQAVIDLHPWTSRLPDYRRPTYALIDIDPGARTSWEELLVLARLFRTALEHLGVRGFPKTTGKRGIQVWLPVAPRYTFDETRDWVEGLSRAVGASVPELVSWEWQKSDRAGRARLDFTQNALIRTLVAPYAVRPVAHAAVSTPIAWAELDDPELRPDRWDIRSVLPRVEALGDLFAEAPTMEQALPHI